RRDAAHAAVRKRCREGLEDRDPAATRPLEMHRHENGRVLVALRGGTIRIVPQSGAPRNLTWETGKAYWLPADPPGAAAADEHAGTDEIEVVVVELKRCVFSDGGSNGKVDARAGA